MTTALYVVGAVALVYAACGLVLLAPRVIFAFEEIVHAVRTIRKQGFQ